MYIAYCMILCVIVNPLQYYFNLVIDGEQSVWQNFPMKKIRKPFLIAEIGINHNGSINIAKKLIDEAKKSIHNELDLN